MAQTHNFRRAMGGFHREDVVRYIEYMNQKHADQVNSLYVENQTSDYAITLRHESDGSL